jgi:ubiquinone/menaquinone biosynthesis C-methylase UbiE
MTNNLPFAKQEFDWIIATFAIHEIRNQQERIVFLKELRRMLKENGQIIITEHLRDLPNFLAFNIGFFHFYSYANWQKTFNAAELQLIRTKNITPFVTTFFLTKNHESNNTP